MTPAGLGKTRSPRVDTYLRTGFAPESPDARPSGQGLAARVGEAVGAEPTRYSLTDSLDELLPEVRRGRAPYVLFLDQGVELSASHLRRLGRILRRNRGISALTLNATALATVYGDSVDSGAADGNGVRGGFSAGRRKVPQRLAPIRQLPSWLAVVNRDLLERQTVLDAGFQTLEFLLIDLCRQLAEQEVPRLRMSSAEIGLDSRFWARDLIEHSAERLAADYRRYRELHGSDRVPPQFRIEIPSEIIPDPGRLAAGELRAEFPKISILCPVWKSEFLEEMLGSILQQSWRSWELLILVDGPPQEEQDRIIEILARVGADPRISWRCQENRGTGPTRATLAEEASGDFLLSIDDDDLLPAHALEVLAGAVRKHPTVRCFRGGTRLVGLVNRYLPPRRRLIIHGITNDPFEVSQPCLIERSTLRVLGGFEWDRSLRNAGEDTYLFHKLDQAGIETVIIDQPLYLRRLSISNLSLSFEHGEVLSHFANIERRFCPAGWRVTDRHNELQDDFQRSITTYRHGSSGREVVTATRFFQYKTLGDRSLASIDLEITSLCNAVCTFCPREVMPEKSSFMSMEVVQALADQLAREPRQRQVILCGIGESTLHPQLPEIVTLLSAAGARVCMTNNGSRIDRERFRHLVECGLKELNFSLNATTPETHYRVMKLRKFDQIKRDVLEILDEKRRSYPNVKIHVSFVLCNMNQHEVHDFIGEWRRQPVSRIWIHPVNNRAGLLNPDVEPVDLEPLAATYGDEDSVTIDIFEHAPERDNICKIARSMDFISVTGDLKLCAMDYERRTDYGNIRYNQLQHIHLEKILSYQRGETSEMCEGCDFCPASGPIYPPESATR